MAKRSNKKPGRAVDATRVDESARSDLSSAEFVVSDRSMMLLRTAVIIIAVAWVYSPVFHGAWLWDDDWYILNQPMVGDLAGLWKTWFQPGSWIEYYPLEETLLWIEWHLFGRDTLGYHLVTIALHAGNALLVWRLLAKLGLGKAWLGGLIFAVHPAAVDSVAWIAETKNTMSTLPCLLAMAAWVDYENRRKPQDYALALLFFVLAMLCKIAVTPLPVVLLLYAWWKRREIGWRDVGAAAPFFAVALILAKISLASGDIYLQRIPSNAGETMPELGLASRLVLAGESLGVYFTHLFWPVGLLPNYPQWTVDPRSPLSYVPWLIVGAVFLVLWFRRGSWGAPALLGVGFFLLFLAPFLGFVVAAYMAFTWIMDHFLYIAMIGPIGLAVAALESVEAQAPSSWRVAVTGAATLIVTLLAFESHGYSVAYIDEATLWTYTVEHDPGDWLAHDNLGKALVLLNQPEEAERQLRMTLSFKPHSARVHFVHGRALVELNRVTEGIAEYDTALAITPSDPEIYNQKGVALLQLGRIPEALTQFEQAIKLRPYYAIAYNNIGTALAQQGQTSEAIEKFTQAVNLTPDFVEARDNLGTALLKMGRMSEAVAQFQQALRIQPDDPKALQNMETLPPSVSAKP
jgi:protein O-mannosyl-transferase